MEAHWDAKAILNRLVEIVKLPTVGVPANSVYKGVPESLAASLSAYVCLGERVLEGDDDTGRMMRRVQSYLVVFAYRVSGAEATAEEKLADAVNEFEHAVLTDAPLKTLLPGAPVVDARIAGQVEYQVFASREHRVYPFSVQCRQWREYTP
jgi:hypothetical protein